MLLVRTFAPHCAYNGIGPGTIDALGVTQRWCDFGGGGAGPSRRTQNITQGSVTRGGVV